MGWNTGTRGANPADMKRRGLSLYASVLAGSLCCQAAVADAVGGNSALASSSALSDAARGALRQELAQLAKWVQRKNGRLSAQFVDVGSGQILAESDAERAQNPASNLKLLTAGAALDRLGPAHRFRTLVLGELSQGAVKDLVLQGDGDPDLRAEHLNAMAHTLVLRGLRQVRGEILVDASAFDARPLAPGFEAQPKEQAAFRAPIWALSVDRNAVTVFVAPGASGEPAQVWTAPDGVATVQGKVGTTAAGSGQKAGVRVLQRGDRLAVQVDGSIAAGLPVQQLRRRIPDPSIWAGLVFAQALRRAGVQVSGAIRAGSGSAPVLAEHTSQPLRVLVHALGKESDNFVAEMLLKAIAARAKGRPGTSSAGAAEVFAYAKSLGVPAGDLEVRNGSGLFDGGSVSARGLATFLSRAYQDSRVGPELTAQLAIGGVDGTLRSRFRTHAGARRVRAKTGTLAKVIALSGFVLGSAGRGPVAFSILVQDVRAPHADTRARVDRVVASILSK